MLKSLKSIFQFGGWHGSGSRPKKKESKEQRAKRKERAAKYRRTVEEDKAWLDHQRRERERKREEKRRERKMNRAERKRIEEKLEDNIALGMITNDVPETNGNGRQSSIEGQNKSYDPMLEAYAREQKRLRAQAAAKKITKMKRDAPWMLGSAGYAALATWLVASGHGKRKSKRKDNSKGKRKSKRKGKRKIKGK